MKAVTVILASVLCLNLSAKPVSSVSSDRQQVVKNILKNARVISEEVEFSDASSSELKNALSLIKEAKRIILGKNDVSESSLRCISRDNDNRAPYVYATLKSDFTLEKISESLFTTSSLCEQALSDAKDFSDAQVLCISRDGDDRAPWVSAKLQGNTLIKDKAFLFTSYQGCREAFSSGKVVNGKYAFCTSRDADDRAPYIIGLVDRRTGGLSKASGEYGSIAECQSFLR